MLQALYNGLSGLFGFSKSLDNIGNNISNMNTPGYRGQSAFFESVADDYGTELSQEFTNLSEGDIQQTGTGTDVAINGKGLFILRDTQGNTYYTREGHFQFDSNGFLVDDTTGYRVASINSSGGLSDFSIADLIKLPPAPTTEVDFTGNLLPTDTTHDVSGIQIYDASGATHALTATFTNNKTATPGSWLVTVKDDSGNTVGNGQIRFNATDGTLQAGYTSISLNLNYNGTAQAVTLSFGTASSFTGTTQIAGTASNIGAQAKDGHGVVGIASESFDANGILQLTYTDNEKKSGPQLALAYVADEQQLQASNGALYTAPTQVAVSYGKAGTAQFGPIEGGSLEQSNVDLTQELTEMIIVQRGYQASSRVLTVTDSMLQELYSSTGGGGG